MPERTIPIVDSTRAGAVPHVPEPHAGDATQPIDRLSRPLRDLRISVTDRCNFRCVYCMPKESFARNHRFVPHDNLLRFEEITRLARLFAGLGVRKLRLTGGEPLLRRGVEDLVAMLCGIRGVDGLPIEIAMTTNGSLLARKAQALKQAGLARISVSLDSLDDGRFRRMNDVDFPVGRVLDGIEKALEAGLAPLKVNMVVHRGVNDDQILPMLEFFRGTGVIVRFIEFMDVGNTNGWRRDAVVPSQEVLQRIRARHALRPLMANIAGETAERWELADGSAEFGLISSVTRTFCGDCNRARLSAVGQLYLCLFNGQGHDLRALLRGAPQGGVKPADDAQLGRAIALLWRRRIDRYSEVRGLLSVMGDGNPSKVEMSYIGG